MINMSFLISSFYTSINMKQLRYIQTVNWKYMFYENKLTNLKYSQYVRSVLEKEKNKRLAC
jgi:hypothetical protein